MRPREVKSMMLPRPALRWRARQKVRGPASGALRSMRSGLWFFMSARRGIPPAEAVQELGRHILLDGFGMVLDLERSRGSHAVDAASGRTLLDLYGCFGSLPIGF